MKRERAEMVKELARLREEKVGTAELDPDVVHQHEKHATGQNGSGEEKVSEGENGDNL
jgi:hypothetical protein